jgi:uncharacterized protein
VLNISFKYSIITKKAEFFLKLHQDTNAAFNTITGYGTGFIEINQIRFDHAIAFGAEGQIKRWSAISPADISTALLLQACGLTIAKSNPLDFLDETESTGPNFEGDRPEVLLVGTGVKQFMLPHAVTSPLLKAGIGVETMSTQAAARTFNILMAEGRRVMTALLTE